MDKSCENCYLIGKCYYRNHHQICVNLRDYQPDYSTLKSQLQTANEQIERIREKLDKARELFEDYHLVWCGVAECGECIIDDCALRELGLLLYEYESEGK